MGRGHPQRPREAGNAPPAPKGLSGFPTKAVLPARHAMGTSAQGILPPQKHRGFTDTGSQSPRGSGGQMPQSGQDPGPGRADKQEDLGRIPWEKPPAAHAEGRVQGCTALSRSVGWPGRGCRALPGPPPFPSTSAPAQPSLASDGKHPPLKAPTAPKPRAADSCCIAAREAVAAFPH